GSDADPKHKAKFQEFNGRSDLHIRLDAYKAIVLGASLHAANLSDGIKLNHKLSLIDDNLVLSMDAVECLSPTIPPSPDYTLASPDYSPASDSESDPSEDPSSDHIPPLPAISPFLSSMMTPQTVIHQIHHHHLPMALSPVRADLIPSPKRVKDSGYLADVEVDPREISLRWGAVEVTYETLGDLVQRFHDHTQAIPVHRIQAI
ncbi:putative reverse transcriptase domain-containing protein, partial [Tanacetum coccineum]